jgi:hypothetical protein
VVNNPIRVCVYCDINDNKCTSQDNIVCILFKSAYQSHTGEMIVLEIAASKTSAKWKFQISFYCDSSKKINPRLCCCNICIHSLWAFLHIRILVKLTAYHILLHFYKSGKINWNVYLYQIMYSSNICEEKDSYYFLIDLTETLLGQSCQWLHAQWSPKDKGFYTRPDSSWKNWRGLTLWQDHQQDHLHKRVSW